MPQYEPASRRKPPVKKKVKKQNFFVALLSGLFPWKGDTKSDVIRKLVFLASIIILAYALISILYFYVFRDMQNTLETQKWAEMKEKNHTNEVISVVINDEDDDTTEDEQPVEVLSEYMTYYDINNDFVGWIEIYPFVNYPVAQYSDNEYYLKHNFEGIPTENGTIFADCDGKFSATETPHNIILYGHNLITNNYFQPLSNYRKSFDFLKDNYLVKFDTLYKRSEYKIFSVFLTNTNEEHGEVFDYNHNVYFNSKKQFNDFVSECLDRSYYYTGVDLQYGDELLTMSTCDFSMFADMRLVVVARKVRENESPLLDPETFIDNTGNDENGSVRRKMFDAYYTTYNTQWGGRNWDPAYVKDLAETEAMNDSE